MPPEPAHRLAPGARWLWRLQGLIATAVVVAATSAAQSELPGGRVWLLLPVAVLAIGVGAVPELRWRRWRYEVRDEEIDLRHGTIWVTRTLVPMLRVQHVDTTRGPLEQLFGLATVSVHSAAGATTIPALEDADAAQLRDRIAALARTPDEL
ncbi:MAG TPA: PH domain-containing protein [Solirubrobacteraceae bacterium]|nr:PH domain-containing protein [Solirubrobacteraceae bacterium]